MNQLIEIGNFIQNQIFGMKWLNDLVGIILSNIGIDSSTRIGSSIQFFIYDVIKIVILLCVLIFIISYIQSYFPPERSRRILSKFKGISANIVAALLGTVTPFCSCSSIPLFIGFTSAKLPLSVTFSFLISSPMVDLASLVLLMSIFGFNIAVLYVLFGLVVAILGGLFIGMLKMENEVQEFVYQINGKEIELEELSSRKRLNYAKRQVTMTLQKVFVYILIGVGIGAIIHNWIPNEWIIQILGENNMFSVFVATLVGIPIYADIFGTIPISEALLYKGAQLGTCLSFMMAVTTLSLPSLIMLKQAIKIKLLLVFILVCTVGIISVGVIFNFIQGII